MDGSFLCRYCDVMAASGEEIRKNILRTVGTSVGAKILASQQSVERAIMGVATGNSPLPPKNSNLKRSRGVIAQKGQTSHSEEGTDDETPPTMNRPDQSGI